MTNAKQQSRKADPAQWVDQYGDVLFGYALSRVHDRQVAEDLVQETMLSALRAFDRFAGTSSTKTWLIAILKHKIIDHFRLSSRYVNNEADDVDDDEFFEADGHWRAAAAPTNWNATPERLLEGKELGREIQLALAKLPEQLRIVFILREIEGLESQEICRIMDLSPNNYWVRLHRARLRLRDEIEKSWRIRSVPAAPRPAVALAI